MSLREKLTQEIKVNEEIVEDGADRYLFRGSPSFSSLIMPERIAANEKEKDAALWSAISNTAFDPEAVSPVYYVHSTLVAADWNGTEWVEVAPYDIAVIAMFAIQNGPLFLKMVAAAQKVLGMASGETFDSAVVPNSEEPQEPSS